MAGHDSLQTADLLKEQRRRYYVAVLVSLITFIIYLPSVGNLFIGEWDDNVYVFDNPHIRSVDLVFLKWAFSNFYAANWHPLTWISHALDYAMWGQNPLGHHLTNNLLHATNTFLVVLLVMRLLESVHNSRFTLIAASVTGLLFGLHPLQVESVAWISERKNLLCALFFLLSIREYMSYWTKRTYRAYILSFLFFILALLSKPMAVSLPAVLLLLDWYPSGRIDSWKTLKSAFVEKIPFVLLSLCSSLITLVAQKSGGAVATLHAVPISSRLLVAGRSLFSYIWNTIAPLRLRPLYPYPENISLEYAEYFLPVILFAALTVACIMIAKKNKVLLSVWLYYVVALVPMLGIVQVGDQPMADRYMYLPCLGPFFLTGMACAKGAGKIKTIRGPNAVTRFFFITACLVVIALMSYLTLRQTGIWKNSLTFWNYEIGDGNDPVPAVAYGNRGVALGKMRQYEKSIEDFDRAIVLDPAGYPQFYLNRGFSFLGMGMTERATEDFRRACRLGEQRGCAALSGDEISPDNIRIQR